MSIGTSEENGDSGKNERSGNAGKQRIIICGMGFMGAMHVQVYSLLENALVAAVVDERGAEAGARLEQLGVNAPVYPTLKEALAAVEADAVDICLPTDFHEAYVLEAAAAGKAIFCEKPLSLDTASADRMVAAAAKAGVAFQVGQCIRFWPEYQAFREIVRSGRAGALKSLSLQRRAGRPDYSVGNWLNEAARSKGAALDLHIHDTDFVVSLLGSPRAVTSTGRMHKGALDHIYTIYHYDQCSVVAEGGWDYPARWGFQMAFQAVFENGAVEFDSTRGGAGEATLTGVFGDGEREALPFEKASAGDSKAGIGNVSDLGGYFNELRYFIDRLAAGEHPQEATGAQARESLRVVEAEIASALCGEAVVIE